MFLIENELFDKNNIDISCKICIFYKGVSPWIWYFSFLDYK